MPAKSARDFQAFRVLSNEMTMRRDLERVAMRSTPCNREILIAIRHPEYVPMYVTCEIFRICTLFANLLPQPHMHLPIPVHFLISINDVLNPTLNHEPKETVIKNEERSATIKKDCKIAIFREEILR